MSEYTEPIPGIQNYEASNSGNIYSVSHNWRGYGKRKMKQYEDVNGYLKVRLTENGERKKYFVHRLVLKTFKGLPPKNKKQTRHLDGNKKNNHIDNLVWGNAKENAQDRDRHGVQFGPRKGEKNHNSKLTEDDVREIKSLLKNTNKSTYEIADMYNVHQGTIAPIKTGRTWSHV